jgi:hypothetical protein
MTLTDADIKQIAADVWDVAEGAYQQFELRSDNQLQKLSRLRRESRLQAIRDRKPKPRRAR